MIVFSLLASLILLSIHMNQAAADEYNEFLMEMFFVRQPSARAEALGRGYVAIVGHPFSGFYNPASVGGIEGMSFYDSYGRASRLKEGARYMFWGGVFEVGKYGVVGLSRYDLEYVKTRESVPDVCLVTLSLCSALWKNVHLGFNVNRICDYYPDEEDAVAYWADLGFLKSFGLGSHRGLARRLTVGGSVSNISNSTFEVLGQIYDLPSTLRLGSSFEMWWSSDYFLTRFRTLGLLIHTEYQDLLNSGYHTALRFGGEISLFEIAKIRLGHYRENLDGETGTAHADRLKDTVSGLGIELPIDRISGRDVPILIRLDHVKMTPTGYTQASARWGRFSLWTFGINWNY
jgi:hypothetical protein